MADEPFAVQKQQRSYTLLEKLEVKPAPRVCVGSRYGMVCLGRRPQQSILTEVHGAQWVQSQRVEHLPVMHDFWWEDHLEHGLGYANGRWTRQESQVYFFGRSLCRLGTARLPHGIAQAAAGAQGWYIVGQDEHVYSYSWEGQPRWEWKLPPRVQRRREDLVEFAMGTCRRPPLIAAKDDRIWVSSGAQLRCLDDGGKELWCQALPCKPNPSWNLSDELLRTRLSKPNMQFVQEGMQVGACFRWEWDSRREQPGCERGMWLREEESADDQDGIEDIEVASALEAGPHTVFVGTCGGELLGWSRTGDLQTRLRLGEGAVWSLCVNQDGLHAAQSGDELIYFEEGQISGRSSHRHERPSIAASKGGMIMWTRHETWTADVRGVVQWAAAWAKPVVACVPLTEGFAVLAGSCAYRFTGCAPHGRGTEQNSVSSQIPEDDHTTIRANGHARSADQERQEEAAHPVAPANTEDQTVPGAREKMPAWPGSYSNQDLAAQRGVAVPAKPAKVAGQPGGRPAKPTSQRTNSTAALETNQDMAPRLRAGSKRSRILELLRRPGGASMQELSAATGWQTHSVRGFISGVLGKQMGLTVISSEQADGQKRYSI